MNIPSSIDQLLLFFVFVLPGITFTSVRVSLSGWRGPDYGVGARVLEALFVSAIFDFVYLLLLGEKLASQVRTTTDFLSIVSTLNVFVSLLLLIVLPALVAVVAFLRPRIVAYSTTQGKRSLKLISLNNYRSAPQSWDFKVLNAGGLFVRVRLESGVYFGGWYAGKSLASTYPYARDIFVESQWRIDSDGSFLARVENTAGVWIPITDKTVVEWINPSPELQKEDTHG